MRITVDIPDNIATALSADNRNLQNALLEATAIDAYRTSKLSEEQVRLLLGYETRMEVHDLLARHNVPLQYDADDLAHDIAASELLHSNAA